MTRKSFYLLPLAAAVAALFTAFTPSLSREAVARSTSFHGGQFVNVNVGFNAQVPLTDTGEPTLLRSQQSGRNFIYRMAARECTILKETIAKTCRLTNLNISAQIRDQNNRGPIKLHLNGNAQFAITLKEGNFD
jgi:hypothetical protein